MNQSEIEAAIVQALGEVAPEFDGKLDPKRLLREQAEIDSFDYLNFLIRLHELTGVEVAEGDYASVEAPEALTGYILAKQKSQ